MAVGETLATWEALAAIAPAGAAATLDLRNGHVVLDFAADSAEATYLPGVLPSNYAGGDLEARIHWTASSGTSGAVRWKLRFERLEADGPDLDSEDFQAAAAATSAAPAAAGTLVRQTVALAEVDSAAAGDAFRLVLQRDATHDDDDLPGDAELLAVELREA